MKPTHLGKLFDLQIDQIIVTLPETLLLWLGLSPLPATDLGFRSRKRSCSGWLPRCSTRFQSRSTISAISLHPW
jgi:hypothetical protein